ncbi:Predicted aminoglycoside phosphotransferase [gamma proteobacterium HdN1]|nr:Predicted aminoglycoside phosphotransferase [gamma proteobacterium HdN1]
MSLIDEAREIRKGEQLDVDKVDAWIKTHVPNLQGALRLRQFPGGASNLTYHAAYDNADFILRRPPFGTKAKSAHDMGREFRVMQALKPIFPLVPEMVAFCDDASVMGCDFYLMERIQGIIPRAELPEGLTLSPAQIREMCTQAIDTLIALHKAPWQGTPLANLGKPDGYVQRQIEGWSERYRAARTDNVPDFEWVMDWLHKNMPAQSATVVVHNDYRFDNLVFDPKNPTQIIGVLDWEMATLGDPLMDLGNSLCYWIQADDPAWIHMMRQQPTHLPGMMSRDEVVAYYCEKMGFENLDFLFYRLYGLFRIAVILQQIYYRFYHKQTQDPRFAPFYKIVNALNGYCCDLINTSSLKDSSSQSR